MKPVYLLFLILPALSLISCRHSNPQENKSVSVQETATPEEKTTRGYDPGLTIIFPSEEKEEEEYPGRGYYWDYDEESENNENPADDETLYIPIPKNNRIATGYIQDEYTVFNESFESGKEWICLYYSLYESDDPPKVRRGTTTHEGEDWLGQPLTFTDIKDKDCGYSVIAFQGDYPEQEVTFHTGEKYEEGEKAIRLLSLIRDSYETGELERPFKLATDTLSIGYILEYHIEESLFYCVLLKTSDYSDSDSNYTNELLYLISGNSILYIQKGMGCWLPFCFSLHDTTYLLLSSYTYAEREITLFDIHKSLAEPIFTDDWATD